MPVIEDVQKKSSDLLRSMGSDWLDNRLDPETTFKIRSNDDDGLTTTLNYMLWRGWIERVPILSSTEGIISAWKLTYKGQELALSSLHGPKPKPPPTPAPSEGKPC